LVGRRSFSPRLRHEGHFLLAFLLLSAHESLSLLASHLPLFLEGHRSGLHPLVPGSANPTVSPLSGECLDRVNRLPRLTMPSADFCIAIGVSCDSLSPVSRTRLQISRGKYDRLPHTTAESTLSAHDGYGLRSHRPARPAPNASYPVFVHRLVLSLGASFRPRLAADALALCYPSPPSGWWKTFTSELSYMLGNT
jgi:hypothetical protein